MFEVFDGLDRVGDGGAFVECFEDREVAVGVVFVLDERLP